MESAIEEAVPRGVPSTLCRLIHEYARMPEFRPSRRLLDCRGQVRSIIAFRIGGLPALALDCTGTVTIVSPASTYTLQVPEWFKHSCGAADMLFGYDARSPVCLLFAWTLRLDSEDKIRVKNYSTQWADLALRGVTRVCAMTLDACDPTVLCVVVEMQNPGCQRRFLAVQRRRAGTLGLLEEMTPRAFSPTDSVLRAAARGDTVLVSRPDALLVFVRGATNALTFPFDEWITDGPPSFSPTPVFTDFAEALVFLPRHVLLWSGGHLSCSRRDRSAGSHHVARDPYSGTVFALSTSDPQHRLWWLPAVGDTRLVSELWRF